MITDLSRTKIKVNSPEESKKVQERAFELGWGWSGNKQFYSLESKYLFFNEDREISHMAREETYFKNHKHIEITLKDLFDGDETVWLTRNQLKPNTIYYVEYGDYKYIYKTSTSDYIHINKQFFSVGFLQTDEDSYRLATQEEKQWLEACIKAGKFVSKEELPEEIDDEKPNEFKEGDYIVNLYKDYPHDDSYKLLHCYKQRENNTYLITYLDSDSSKTNGWNAINFKNKSTWRYATPEEAEEYERRGKPYDVEELKKDVEPIELKENTWYISKDDNKYLVFRKKDFNNFGFDDNNYSTCLNCIYPYNWREATKEEVASRFEKYCKIHYPVGCRVLRVNSEAKKVVETRGEIIKNTSVNYHSGVNIICYGNVGNIFVDGVWAEKIEEEEKEKDKTLSCFPVAGYCLMDNNLLQYLKDSGRKEDYVNKVVKGKYLAWHEEKFWAVSTSSNRPLYTIDQLQIFFSNKKESTPNKMWQPGTYVVFLEDNIQNNQYKKYDIAEIRNSNSMSITYKNCFSNTISGRNSVADKLAWFETKEEAEKFVTNYFKPSEDSFQHQFEMYQKIMKIGNTSEHPNFIDWRTTDFSEKEPKLKLINVPKI